MIKSNFKAIFNIFTKKLAVLYGDCISHYTFTDQEEWTKISFNGDENNPNYLHVQVDYDEEFQLLFYPREDGDPDLHEGEGTYFHSIAMNIIPKNLTIVCNDLDFNMAISKLQKHCKNEVIVPEGL